MNSELSSGFVVAVSRSDKHSFSKQVQQSIRLIEGLGVEGDAHLGTTVQHLSRVRKDPTQANLRQVHLLALEMIDELNVAGFELAPGAIGENILTSGVELLRLPRGTLLRIGASAIVEVKGLRDPCRQLDRYRPGLMAAVLDRDEFGNLVRKAGIMASVRSSGEVSANDPIRIELPSLPHEALDRV